MSKLVGKREDGIQLAGEVQKDVGVGAVAAPGVRAAGLAAVLVYVDPAVGEGVL